MTCELIDAADLRPGDRIDVSAYHPEEPVVVVVHAGEWHREIVGPLIGRPVLRYWCRNERDPTREGFMSYAPGARVLRVVG